MIFNFARLGTRLVTVLALILGAFVVISVAIWVGLGEVESEARGISEQRVPQVERVGNMRTESARAHSLTRQSLLDTTPDQLKKTQAELAQSLQTLHSDLDAFEKTIFSKEARQQVADMRVFLASYVTALDQFQKHLDEGNREAALAQLPAVQTARAPMLKVLVEKGVWQNEILRQRTQLIEAEAISLKNKLAVMMATLLAVAVAASVWLTKQLHTRLTEATQVAQRVAANDLAEPVAVTGNDEFTALLREMASMRDALHGVVAAARQASDNIQGAANEVAYGNQDLSNRTEAAASNLEETASSMEEITATLRQSADAASQANQLASSATEVAIRGGQVVSQVVSTMNDINRSSQQIANIIGVIDAIAFQTNILALNAAVEAARAGEQGRGFAVVALEVRNLAGRSAQAAKEIKDLINASVDKVQSGTNQVQDAGKTMDQIVASVRRVTDVIAEIAAAAAEQSSGIAQVNVAVTQLDQMTQQNAALVEQSTAAAESLRDQANQLAEVVSVFKLNSGASSMPSSAPRAAPRPEQAPSSPRKKVAESSRPESAGANKSLKPPHPKPGPSPALRRPALARPATSQTKPAEDGEWENF